MNPAMRVVVECVRRHADSNLRVAELLDAVIFDESSAQRAWDELGDMESSYLARAARSALMSGPMPRLPGGSPGGSWAALALEIIIAYQKGDAAKLAEMEWQKTRFMEIGETRPIFPDGWAWY